MIYIALIIFSAAVMAGLSGFCWKRRFIPGGTAFSAVLALGGMWMLAIAVMLSRDQAATALIWYRLSLVFVAVLPVLLLLFTLQYSGRGHWVTSRRMAVLSIVPSVTLFTVWTDEYTHLFFNRVSVVEKNGLMVIDQWTPGFWFPAHSVYSFTLVFIALAILWGVAFKQFAIYRKQSIAMISGTLCVILPNLGFAVGVIPPDVIILPFGFLAMGILLTWSIFRHRLFDLMPVARNELVDIMSDGVIVLDTHHRIVDMNPAALSTFEMDETDAIGQIAESVFDRWPELAERFRVMDQPRTSFSITRNHTITHYDVRIARLTDRGGITAGDLILFRDITEEKQKEAALHELVDALQAAKNKADEALIVAENARGSAESANRELVRKNEQLAALNQELSEALDTINNLEGILPICMFCKQIRDDNGQWNQLEAYISNHSEADFSHSVCPACAAKHYPGVRID